MKALLVIDMQKSLMGRKLYRKEEFASAVLGAIEAFRRARHQLIFIQHENGFLVPGEVGWELDEALGVRESDTIMRKKRGNAFEKTGLTERLRSMGVDGVLVCGLVTHGCVRASCLGALQAGYRTALLSEGHSSWAKDARAKKEAIESELAAAGAEIVSAGALVEFLSGR